MAGCAKALSLLKAGRRRSATWAQCSSPATRSCSASSRAASMRCAASRPAPGSPSNESSRRYESARFPRSGETRPPRRMRSLDMERNKDLVDYLLGVTLLAVILIVGLAVLGNELANVLH